MKHLTFILMCCLALSSQAAIYKWVNKQGNTHFSDSPEQPNAKKIKLLPVQTYTAPTQQVEHVNVEAVNEKKELSFKNLTKKNQSKLELIVTFLAVLDLIRLGICYVVQDAIFGELKLVKINKN